LWICFDGLARFASKASEIYLRKIRGARESPRVAVPSKLSEPIGTRVGGFAFTSNWRSNRQSIEQCLSQLGIGVIASANSPSRSTGWLGSLMAYSYIAQFGIYIDRAFGQMVRSMADLSAGL